MSFELKKSYNFSTLAPTQLGGDYSNMKVKAILTSDNAVAYRDVATLHQTIKSVISNLPDSISDLTYILFEDLDKSTLVLPIEYIQTDSILEVQTVNARIDIPDISSDDITTLKVRLQELGYTNFKIYTY